MMGTKIKLSHLTVETRTTKIMTIYDEETRELVEGKARRAMARGATITWGNGVEQWVENCPVIGEGFKLIFHNDGNRIRTEVVQKTKQDGEISLQVLRTVWMDYDKVFNE